VAALALAGCALPLPDKPPRTEPYDLGPPPAAGAAATPGAPLALAPIEASPALDSQAMVYRLLYAGAGQQPRPYAQARWSMPPPQLLALRLRQQLSQQRVVLSPAEGPASLVLRVELEEFTQVFETPERSVGLVRLRATLLETAGGRERLVAQRRFTAQKPAPSPDASGGVRALTAATDAAVEAIAQWLQQIPPAGR